MGTLAGWAYRKAITINHTGDGAQTNYQMKVTLVKGAGADSTGVIYLGNHCLNWPTDILFTLSDGTTTAGADFWREESDATDGTWWLEADSIPAHPDDFLGYIYYGKADAADASNGANTFPFFDDFDVDTSKWANDTASMALASSIMSFTSDSGWNKIWGNVSCGVSARYRTYSKIITTDGTQHTTPGLHNAATGDVDYALTYGYTSGTPMLINMQATAGHNHNTNFTYDTWKTWEIRLIGNTSSRLFENDVECSGSPNDTYAPNVNTLRAYIGAYRSTGTAVNIQSDWVFLANLTANEPTFAASGAEEALGSIIRSVPRMMRIMLMSP